MLTQVLQLGGLHNKLVNLCNNLEFLRLSFLLGKVTTSEFLLHSLQYF